MNEGQGCRLTVLYVAAAHPHLQPSPHHTIPDTLALSRLFPKWYVPHHAIIRTIFSPTNTQVRSWAIGLLLFHPRHLWLSDQDQAGGQRPGTRVSALPQRSSRHRQGAHLVRTLLGPPHPDEKKVHLHLRHLPVAGTPGRRLPTPPCRRRRLPPPAATIRIRRSPTPTRRPVRRLSSKVTQPLVFTPTIP